MTRPSARVLSLLLLAAVLVLPSTAAFAAEAPPLPALGIAPVDHAGSWFELELEPGSTEHLAVEVANHGEGATSAVSYAADSYTLVNGGMGVELRDEPDGGATGWLAFPDEVVELAAGQAVRRTLAVQVPEDAEAGEYLAALVVENDEPVRSQAQLGFDQVVRQAIAVSITIPGPAEPALVVGPAEHKEIPGASVALVEVENPGNRHLAPSAELTLTDADGAVLGTREFEMDRFYAGTTTQLELPVPEPLAPGEYTMTADLTDAEYEVAARGATAFEVAAPPISERSSAVLDRIGASLGAPGLPGWALLVAAVGLVGIGTLLPVVVRRRKGVITGR